MKKFNVLIYTGLLFFCLNTSPAFAEDKFYASAKVSFFQLVFESLQPDGGFFGVGKIVKFEG